MAKPEATSAGVKLLTLVAIVVAVAGLYLARTVLIPFALAVLFSFLLAPLVRRLERLGLWRLPSVLLVSVLVFAILAGLGYVVAGQVVQFAERLPEYRSAIEQRIESLQAGAGSWFGQATANIQRLSEDLTRKAPATTTAPTADVQPTPVQVVEGPTPPLEMIVEALGPLLGPLATAAIVVIFVIFILVQRQDMRDRLIRLAGEDRVDVTTQAMDDAARRISRYLLMQVAVNASLGVATAIGLSLIGLPNAILWGLLSGALRFIPYIGIWVSALLPITISLAVFPDSWWPPLAVAGLFITLEFVSGNFVEPLLYGGSTGISPLAVLVAAVFWAWLWGPIGLLLSTPLTVCLAVAGKYVPTLSFLDVLLGDRPVLDPPVRLYQRLLAERPDEAEDLAEECLEDHGLMEVYDDLLVPALHLAELDRHRGRLDNDRLIAVQRGMRELLTELADRAEELSGTSVGDPQPMVAAETPPPANLQALCLPARDESDEIVAGMLAQVLTNAGIASRMLPANAMVGEMLDRMAAINPKIVCISAMPPEAMAKARYLCKRVRARFPQTRIIVGFWNQAVDAARIRPHLTSAGADHVVTDLAGALKTVRPSLASRTTPT